MLVDSRDLLFGLDGCLGPVGVQRNWGGMGMAEVIPASTISLYGFGHPIEKKKYVY